MANSKRCSLLQSTFAPTSKTKLFPPLFVVGIKVAIAGRDTPFILPSLKVDKLIVAPL